MTTLEQWWEEDAERLNALAESARKQGITIDVLPKKKAVEGMETMKYVYHDGVILRRTSEFADVEVYGWKTKEWFTFIEPDDGDIRQSSTVAWLEGTPLTEEQALAKIKKLG